MPRGILKIPRWNHTVPFHEITVQFRCLSFQCANVFLFHTVRKYAKGSGTENTRRWKPAAQTFQRETNLSAVKMQLNYFFWTLERRRFLRTGTISTDQSPPYLVAWPAPPRENGLDHLVVWMVFRLCDKRYTLPLTFKTRDKTAASFTRVGVTGVAVENSERSCSIYIEIGRGGVNYSGRTILDFSGNRIISGKLVCILWEI